MPQPFPVDQALTAITLGYQNGALLADQVMPRVAVAGREFKWTRFTKEDRFTIPNTLVGRKGQPNEVEFSATEETGSVLDYGLEDAIPQEDILAAKRAVFDPVARATALTTELVELDRESRVSNVVMNAATYTHSEALSGTDKFSDPASKPLITLNDALETPWMRPNVVVLSRKIATALRTNPSVIKAFNGSLGDDGLVPLSFIQQTLEIPRILIGDVKINTSAKGESAVYTNIWHKGNGGISMLYLDANAQPKDSITFGLTAEWETRVAMRKQDDSIGLRGGTRIRVGESVNELVIAPDAGYFIDEVL